MTSPPQRYAISAFQGTRAFADLETLCRFGPRCAGSEANAIQRAWLKSHFTQCGADVLEQRFQAPDPLTGEPVELVNVIASWHPGVTPRILLGAHADTRPFPDLDPDPALRLGVFLGANDGASGLACLTELARILGASETQAAVGVDFLCFDAEEWVYDKRGDYCLGSRHAVEQLLDHRIPHPADDYLAVVVVDMIGAQSVRILPEQHSLIYAPELTRQIWRCARDLGESAFPWKRGPIVYDDHVPFLEVGIPATLLIDFAYPEWHTAADLPEKCSPQSLSSVGSVLLAWMNLIESECHSASRRSL